jgi:N-acetylglucosamine kinase-like BadF-type ATPase
MITCVMSLYVCLDCGASKTCAVICDASGIVVGRSLCGPSNFTYLGIEAFSVAIRDAVDTALQSCTLPHSFAYAWLGISGVDSPSTIETIKPILSKLLEVPVGPKLIVTNDTHLLAAPIRLHPDISHAIAVIGGTGSICVSFKYENGTLEELGRMGGWGWMLGDEGGGYHVGREAIRQILLEADMTSVGYQPPVNSTLKTKIFKTFGVKDALELLSIVYLPDLTSGVPASANAPDCISLPREKRLSSLCPLVFTSAFQDRDPLALNVLRTCAHLLASKITLLLQPLVDDVNQRPAKAVLARDSMICFGGSLVGVDAYRTLILDILKENGHVFRYVKLVDDPAGIGAAGLASVC